MMLSLSICTLEQERERRRSPRGALHEQRLSGRRLLSFGDRAAHVADPERRVPARISAATKEQLERYVEAHVVKQARLKKLFAKQ
jgi:hypothetical protein